MLHQHEVRLPPLVEEALQRTAIPLSEIDAAEFTDWVDSKKTVLGEIEGDVRDAKRRITAAKGPRPKPKVRRILTRAARVMVLFRRRMLDRS